MTGILKNSETLHRVLYLSYIDKLPAGPGVGAPVVVVVSVAIVVGSKTKIVI